jgi:hypothetical protein
LPTAGKHLKDWGKTWLIVLKKEDEVKEILVLFGKRNMNAVNSDISADPCSLAERVAGELILRQ